MESFRELIVWQRSLQLVKCVYEETKGFPREEIFGLKLQMRRCAISIASNIAEGYGRHHTVEYVRFLQISRGSLNELITQLEIARSLDYLQDIGDTIRECDEIGRMLNTLIRKLSNSSNK
jgi:four helix bundle protein